MQIKARIKNGKEYVRDVVILSFLTDSGQYGGAPVAIYYDVETQEINYKSVDHFKFVSFCKVV